MDRCRLAPTYRENAQPRQRRQDRHSVRERAAEKFDTDRIVDSMITAVDMARLGGGVESAANV